MSVLGHILRLNGGEGLKNFKQRIIFCKAIYKVETGFPASYMDDPVDHVKICLDIQLLVKVRNIVC